AMAFAAGAPGPPIDGCRRVAVRRSADYVMPSPVTRPQPNAHVPSPPQDARTRHAGRDPAAALLGGAGVVRAHIARPRDRVESRIPGGGLPPRGGGGAGRPPGFDPDEPRSLGGAHP